MISKRKPPFTPKMEKYCQAYMAEPNAAEAYRQAYDVSKMADKTVQREGWNLLQRPQVQERLAELRDAAMQRNEITVDTLLDELEEARKIAITSAQASAAVGATMGKAKLLGLDKKIVEITGKNGAPISTSSTITVTEKVMNSMLDRL